jgi:hypothetical protein
MVQPPVVVDPQPRGCEGKDDRCPPPTRSAPNARLCSSASLPPRSRLTSATPSESNSLNASRTRSAGSSIRANASAMSPSRSSLLRRLPLWSRSAMPICASASLASPVPCGLRGTTGEALQRHVERLLLDPGRLGGKAQFLQRLDADADRVGGLADGFGCTDRAVDQRGETTDCGDPDQRATQRPDTGAQQLRLAAEALQSARGALARALDALQALRTALAD